MRIITSDEQRKIESIIEMKGTPLIDLMEKAGYFVYKHVCDKFSDSLSKMKIVILCGSGGNGGDGLVSGRWFCNDGINAKIIICEKMPKNQDSIIMYDEATKNGVEIIKGATNLKTALEAIKSADIIIDAGFGIGFRGEFSNNVSELFSACNYNKNAYKLAIDIPSGVGSDSGIACKNAFIADVTITMIGIKPANVFKISSEYVGKTELYDIDIDEKIYDQCETKIQTIEEKTVEELLPMRKENSHKGEFGKLIIVAGSDRYRGAAVLNTKGALVSGVGLISVCASEKVLAAISFHCPEAILIDIDNDLVYFKETLKNATTCTFGSGVIYDKSAEEMFARILKNTTCPLIVDAGGLSVIAKDIEMLKGLNRKIVLTPHLGEFAKLIKKSVEEVKSDKLRLAMDFAKEYNVVLVLKSENTLVADPNGRTYICTDGNSGLAKGGSGDLLCGIISSFCAMKMDLMDASLLGVFAHSKAADLMLDDFSKHSITPSLVLEYLSKVFLQMDKNKKSR